MNVVKLIIAFSLFLFLSTQAFAGDAVAKSVEAVFKEKTQLVGKEVIISGKVVKVNNGIMKRNFLHIQDGTGSTDTNNLIITSSETAKVGDQVVVTGTVALDTDFGFGYKYPLLVEKSSIKAK
ncbi:MAG: hypothetical protein GXP19_03140 [Gammaproteobacteria bacterium]|nr:hypothetical protein [Gammaproteobacteria bacterium]